MHNNGKDKLEKYLKQLNQLSDRLKSQFSPTIEAQKVIEKAFYSPLEPLLKEQNKLQEMLGKIKPPRYELNCQLPGLALCTKEIYQYQQALRSIINPAFEEFQRSFKELPPKIQEALLLLAKHGWYLDLNIPLESLLELKQAIIHGETAEAEDALIKYFDDQLTVIEENIINCFPHRAHIISLAFKAHKKEDYYLSIPVILAQTDGICKDIAGQYLFICKDKKPKTAIYVEQIAADTFKAALLSPLTNKTPIGASEHERKEGFNLLNRHMVLHGESLDYGSKVNSLRALSLINYVSQALKDDVEYP